MTAATRFYTRNAIRPEMTVRQVASDFPDSEQVFRRYGEPECQDGRFGHLEPLTHFARRQGIALETLLSDLAAATKLPVDTSSPFAERVHHGFLLSAMLITLSVGTGWGAWLLWSIGAQSGFDAVRAASIIAHGEAQLWGFIVLFIMGVSLRTVLQGIVRHPLGPWACRALLTLALFGIAGGFVWYLLPGKLAPLAWSARQVCF